MGMGLIMATVQDGRRNNGGARPNSGPKPNPAARKPPHVTVFAQCPAHIHAYIKRTAEEYEVGLGAYLVYLAVMDMQRRQGIEDRV